MINGFGLLVNKPPPTVSIKAAHEWGIGKGLSEPVAPFRKAYFFGATAPPDAGNWNAPPVLLEPGDKFDLSTITTGAYINVVVSVHRMITGGHNWQVLHRWFKGINHLWTAEYWIPDPGAGYWDWFYVYSFIPYDTTFIDENGAYHTNLFFAGIPITGINFSISGIPVAPLPDIRTINILSVPVNAKVGDTIPVELEWSSSIDNSWAAVSLFEPPEYNTYKSFFSTQKRPAGNYRDILQVPIAQGNITGINRVYASVNNEKDASTPWDPNYRNITIEPVTVPIPTPVPTPTPVLGGIGLIAAGILAYVFSRKKKEAK